MEYLLAVLYVPISCVCITTVAVSAADPRAAETASGGYTPDWGGKIFLAASEKKMINLHNREPTKRSLPHLCVHPALKRAADSPSQDVARRDYFFHNT